MSANNSGRQEEDMTVLDPDSNLPELRRLGSQLRARRTERGLSITHVAAAAGLTRGFLSLVERSGSSVSLDSLLRICRVLDINVGELFEQPPSNEPLRKNERRPAYLGGSGVTDYILTSEQDRRIQVLETHIEPGGSPSSQGHYYSYDADILFVLVLSGQLSVRIEGLDEATLDAGDSMYWVPRTPFRWYNPSSETETVVIFVIAPAVF